MFGSCRAAQTPELKQYKSLYHKAGLPFYRNYTLHTNTEKLHLIRGGTGSTWGHNFYMGSRNKRKLELEVDGEYCSLMPQN